MTHWDDVNMTIHGLFSGLFAEKIESFDSESFDEAPLGLCVKHAVHAILCGLKSLQRREVVTLFVNFILMWPNGKTDQ